jgi:hypothetical protein
VAALPGNATVGWVKINAKPLKQALSTWASKWVYLFTHYLQVGGWAGGWVVEGRGLGSRPRASGLCSSYA